MTILPFQKKGNRTSEGYENYTMLLLTNCEVHTAKYSDRSFKYGPNEMRSRPVLGIFQQSLGDFYSSEFMRIFS